MPKKYNTLLAVGISCIILGGILLAMRFSVSRFSFDTWLNILAIFLGGILLYFCAIKIRRGWIFFTGSFLVINGFFVFIVKSGIFSATMMQLWPFIVVFSGVSLFITGIYKFRRIVAFYTVPSFVLVLLGVFFLQFSLHIIKMPIRLFAAMWWPLLFVLLGIGLLITFFYIQHTNKAVIESGDDFDDYYEDIP
ncbi:MAG: hypothetical protein GX297_02420 [Treponema sp.]|nr:hypothetical protein [Treponema sp.]